MSYTAHVLRRYLPILAFISILTMYVEMAVLPSIYRIEEEFGVSTSEVSWVLSAETLGGLALAVSLEVVEVLNLHRLLLDGLPGPPHRSGSPPVAGGSQPLRVSETQGN
jgi:hypothetical protein